MSKKDRVYQQSSVVPWLKEDDEVSVVLITSQSGNWIVPKGLVEPEMTPIESAAKEALEEAGAEGAPPRRAGDGGSATRGGVVRQPQWPQWRRAAAHLQRGGAPYGAGRHLGRARRARLGP